MSLLGRIRAGLARTKQQIVDRFDDLVRGADAPERVHYAGWNFDMKERL